jgi:hypothetical protein
MSNTCSQYVQYEEGISYRETNPLVAKWECGAVVLVIAREAPGGEVVRGKLTDPGADSLLASLPAF